jgi:predicted dithiol-disulfide oxidoreductase (DUF899 family)
MGSFCSYCTLWADGFNGVLPHLEDRVPVVVISPDPPDKQRAFAESRGWRFRMVSAEKGSFIKDMGFLLDDGFWPGASAFHKNDDGSITRISKCFFGPGDPYCAVWHLFALLRGGTDGWEPKLTY